jgi:demethylmenaquinone methyltransferase / 2-methoxy-6-polyprenyl-1,4-benzoquinol methylase
MPKSQPAPWAGEFDTATIRPMICPAMSVHDPGSTAWDDELLRNPHAAADKRSRVQKMFAAIAPSYDINNRLHSLWMDQRWRKKAVKLAETNAGDRIVDVACGTGDLAIKFAERQYAIATLDRLVPVIGIDFTLEMLPIARKKWLRHAITEHTICSGGVENSGAIEFVQWLNGDAQSLPLPDQSADVASIAFGIRNVQSVPTALKEFHRILRSGGRMIILEFSLPTNSLLRGLYNFYFRQILPRTATLISGDKTGAYKYLPESVNTFIGREQMVQMMQEAGFVDVKQFPMTFGVCVCYRGSKK